MSKRPTTPKEKQAIASLKRLAKTWPKSLWLFSNGSLYVMQKNEQGGRYLASDDRDGAMDGEAAVTTINIESDGGDW